MAGDRRALDRLLGGADIAWLVDRVRARAVHAEDQPLSGVVRLRDPSDAQRAAVTRLIGPPNRAAATLGVDLAVVEAMLRRGPWPAGLTDAVLTLTGPVVDRRALRAEEDAGWVDAGAALHPVAARLPGLGRWWEAWCAAGNLKRAARAEAARRDVPPGPRVAAEMVARLAVVLDALPVAQTPLAVFAQQTVGEAHGLDESRPLGRVAAAVVAAAFGEDHAPGDRTAEGLSVRQTWASVGVVLSNVASTVLVLGVRGSEQPAGPGAEAAAAVLEAMRRARTPLVLTLDQVRSGGVPPVPADGAVHVCENPTVVEVVASRWAAQAEPAEASRDPSGNGPVLVCTSGQPSTAVVELLQLLSGTGAQVRYHGDFDWAGLRIAAALGERVRWTPWRYTAADYEDAVRRAPRSLRLRGTPASSPWDADLATRMAQHGLSVEEEAIVEDLVDDLLDGP